MMIEFITPKEAAKYFCITRVTLYRWIKKGLLKAHKVGGVVRINKKDIRKFIKKTGYKIEEK